jgi:hypothetical protein
MKTTALVAALALAAGTAFAQAPNETAKATAMPAAAAATTTTTTTTTTKKATKKKVAKKSAKKKSAQSMGAGPAPIETDLTAGARRARIDEAYANWKAKG